MQKKGLISAHNVFFPGCELVSAKEVAEGPGCLSADVKPDLTPSSANVMVLGFVIYSYM